MSRRTKLIIAALFLVLLAIPAAYIALTWHPTSPLRFRLDQMSSPPQNDPNGYREIRVVIENSCPFPIHFYGAVISKKSGIMVVRELPPGVIEPYSQVWLGDTRLKDKVTIPAYGSIHADGLLGSDLVDLVQKNGVLIHYKWESQTRDMAVSAFEWLQERSPKWAGDPLGPFRQMEEVMPLEASEE